MPDVLVTGGNGFLGRYVCAELARAGYSYIAPSKAVCDLRNSSETHHLIRSWRPASVIHLAADVGGIQANQARPASMFKNNALMGMNVIDACSNSSVRKLGLIGTICSYPKYGPRPFKEENLWDGYPEETNAPYGIAKKMLLTMAQAYRQQEGLNFIYLMPVNLYGPGDNFNLGTCHVIPAMINRLVEARNREWEAVTFWGDGTPTREFLHVQDAARAIVMAMQSYDSPEPVNIGTGEEISISALAQKIAAIVGYKGQILWDPSRPNGQPRRCLDVSRAKGFGFTAEIPLSYGLVETVAWYEKNRPE